MGSFGNCGICGMFRRDGAAVGCVLSHFLITLPKPVHRAARAKRARPSPHQSRVAKEGVLRGSFGLRRLRDAPPKGFHFFQKEIQEDYLTINPSSSQRSCQSLAPSQRNTCPLTRRFPFSRVPILAISSSVSGSSVTHFRLLT